MKEIIALVVIYIVFVIGSLFFYKRVFNVKLIWFILFLPIYLVSVYLYFEVLNQTKDYLRDNGIYLEFGEANLYLVLLWWFCTLNSILLIIFICVKRVINNYKKNKSEFSKFGEPPLG